MGLTKDHGETSQLFPVGGSSKRTNSRKRVAVYERAVGTKSKTIESLAALRRGKGPYSSNFKRLIAEELGAMGYRQKNPAGGKNRTYPRRSASVLRVGGSRLGIEERPRQEKGKM